LIFFVRSGDQGDKGNQDQGEPYSTIPTIQMNRASRLFGVLNKTALLEILSDKTFFLSSHNIFFPYEWNNVSAA